MSLELRPYRPCVGIILINQAGLVWTGQRKTDNNSNLKRWQFPQGGIDEGETAEQAAIRELKEETGVTNAKIIYEAPQWFHYDFPKENTSSNLKKKYRGQSQKWFAMKFEGTDGEINLSQHLPIEFNLWAWHSFEDCPNIVIEFKKDLYHQLVLTFGDIVNRVSNEC